MLEQPQPTRGAGASGGQKSPESAKSGYQECMEGCEEANMGAEEPHSCDEVCGKFEGR